ncbi:MAG: hypothetical protein QF827_14480 [Alphaproteobacteria bacterium]|jgi:class 3 adenylate cyclase|nr:hypothetical protein [Alphaproteobacteria bacterium]
MAEGYRKLAAIMSADVVGCSRLMAADDSATVKTLQDYRQAIARVVERHKGRIVNAPGDNILSAFPSAVEAVEAARAAAVNLRALYPSFAEEAWVILRKWFYSEDLIADIIDGLRKAGPEISDDQG